MSTNKSDDVTTLLRAQISELQTAIDRIGRDDVHRVEDALHSCAGRVLTTGAGTSAIVARKVAHTLNCGGTPTFFVDPTVAIHGSSGAITTEDVLLLFTKGGETDELASLLDTIEGKSTTRIAVTERPESTIGRKSDLVLPLPSVQEVDRHNMIATTSILLVSAIFDAIGMRLMDRRGYSYEQFAKTHPGGAVGKRFAGDPGRS